MSSTDRWIVIPRWEEFQHRDAGRSDRITWIKTYTRLLDDENYLSLNFAQRGLLHSLWLLYAKHKRVVSESGASRKLVGSASDAKYLRRHLEALNHAGFIEFSASKPAGEHASNLPALEVDKEKRPSLEEKQHAPERYRCTHCSITFTPTKGGRRELEAHLTNVHWLEADELTQALTKGTQ